MKLTLKSLLPERLLPLLLLSFLSIISCQNESDAASRETTSEITTPEFYYGADLSYVNEMEDCGAVYKNSEGVRKDPYELFATAGANLVRLRLWHTPEWTDYSTLKDVKRSIARAKESGMRVLLDFHYSDDWADPAKQEIPKAWEDHIDDTAALGKLLYDYTYQTLTELKREDLLPEMVQVGNEINGMILRQGEGTGSIDWERNSYLINTGIKAVRTVSMEIDRPIEIILHIAQPENALWWFQDATANGVTDFDWIGLSYYPNWSEYKFDRLGEVLADLVETHRKKLMIVETAYPYTLDNADQANNILGTEALISGYPASKEGQLNYLLDLEKIVKNSGGQGLIYWEPAWVSTSCSTRWGVGSHWDNATLFDNNGKPTPGMEFYHNNLKKKP
ncbi:arabinogalactan endo-1,4-beta-galactosidase [Robertkochia marina]|uniref:Arabinogalactan endo-beta-1,4-galactanase n=1 Tax=Robertkochia marina TaxID=1227945 RepID=A0A4S3M403_9FLAO|nr:arabinogalactan endo-1,4-beta-galactosidase [Robertkochia marina]THD69876.1 arabinogalactan endo-1,4-beta-galactosidase [Robertkochia marina]TRZ46777.1 arabinogalactan endo-1,4-beta-galactosidase [Robertkochia marina]